MYRLYRQEGQPCESGNDDRDPNGTKWVQFTLPWMKTEWKFSPIKDMSPSARVACRTHFRLGSSPIEQADEVAKTMQAFTDRHERVNYVIGEYARGDVFTKSIESAFSPLNAE